MSIPMPRLGTPEVSLSHQIQPHVGQFQYIRSSVPVQPHIQFQSTYLISSSSLPTSYPVPVYFFQHSSSSLLRPRTSPVCGAFFQSCLYTFKQCRFTWTGSFSWAPLSTRTHLHCMWDFSSLQGLIFIHCSS